MPDERVIAKTTMKFVVALDVIVTEEIAEKFLLFRNGQDPIEVAIWDVLAGSIQDQQVKLRTAIEKMVPVGLFVDFANVSVVPLEDSLI